MSERHAESRHRPLAPPCEGPGFGETRGGTANAGSLVRRPLFRQEAVQFQEHDRQWGQVVQLQSRPAELMGWLIAGAVAGIISFLCLTQYTRKETVAGYLAPLGGTAKVIATRPGVISAIYVQQGQRVEKGQSLLKVSINQVSADGQDVDSTILLTLASQRTSLSQQIEAEERRITTERERLTAQKQGLAVELGYLGTQIATQRERVHVMELLVATATQLSQKGLMTNVEQSRREDAFLEQKQHLNALTSDVVQQQSKMTELRYKLEQLPTVMADKIQSLRNELATVQQRIAEVDGRRAYIIRAPIAGHVASLQASIGQAADPQHVQLQILPAAGTLRAELFIPARAIGFIEVGQDVRILYDAFPYQHFGTYHGRIVDVSQTMLTTADVSSPIALKEPAYRATVALDRPDIDAYGKKVPLQADMLLKADVILDKHTFISWIFSPLISARILG